MPEGAAKGVPGSAFPLFCGHRSDGLLWFRFFGWGFVLKDTRKHCLMFSERVCGHGRSIGPYHVSLLRP